MWDLLQGGEFVAGLVGFEGEFADDLGERLGGLVPVGELSFETLVLVLESAVLVGDFCELRRRFCLPGTWRLTADGVRFKGAASVPVVRYRYRGETLHADTPVLAPEE